MREVGFSAIHCRQAEINGLEACVGFYHGWLDGLGEAIAEAAHIVVHDRTYVVAGVAGWAAYDTLRHAFFGTIRSFVAGPSTTDSVALSDEALSDEALSDEALNDEAVNDEALNDEDCPSAPEAGDDGAGLSRRQHLRVAGPFDGYRLGLLKTPVRVYDLSEGGCFINSLIETTTKGQRFGLKILLPSEGWITVEAAEAIYTRPGFGFAVRFVKLQEYTRARLNQALCKLQSRRDGSASESHSV